MPPLTDVPGTQVIIEDEFISFHGFETISKTLGGVMESVEVILQGFFIAHIDTDNILSSLQYFCSVGFIHELSFVGSMIEPRFVVSRNLDNKYDTQVHKTRRYQADESYYCNGGYSVGSDHNPKEGTGKDGEDDYPYKSLDTEPLFDV